MRPNEIRPHPYIYELTYCHRLIAVPGVGLTRPAAWDDGSGHSWLAMLPPDCYPGLAVYEFEHEITTVEAFSWSGLIHQGSEFLDALVALERGRDEVWELTSHTSSILY